MSIIIVKQELTNSFCKTKQKNHESVENYHIMTIIMIIFIVVSYDYRHVRHTYNFIQQNS